MVNPLQVLLVDDDDLFFDVVTWVLRNDKRIKDSVILDRLRDGDEVLQYFADGESLPRWPHLVLLDQRMSRVDGTEVLRRLRAKKQTRNLLVCMLSSSKETRLVSEAYACGANFYFVKPLALEELQGKLRTIFSFVSTVVEIPRVAGAP